MGFFNPIDEHHWLRERFFPDEIEQKIQANMGRTQTAGFADLSKIIKLDDKTEVTINTLVSHTTYKDNKFISNEDKARLEMFKDLNPEHWKIYAQGQWGRTEGLVYPKGYTIVEKDNYPKDYEEVIYGLDFGWTDPTSLSRYYLKRVDGILHSWCEELIYQRALTTEDLKDLMIGLDIDPNEPIYADHQSAEKIVQLQEATDEQGNHLFNIIPADKDVAAGIDQLRMTVRYSCPENVNHNREVKNYRLRMDNKGRYEDYVVIKYMDHTQDQERYAIYTHSKVPELKMAFI